MFGIKPEARFRPQADRHALLQLVRAAHAAEHDRLLATDGGRAARETVAAHVEALYPQDEMRVLDRLGCAQEVRRVRLSVFDPETRTWPDGVALDLERPLLAPSSFQGVYCGGPRYSADPTCGCKPEYWAKAGEDERRKIREANASSERARVPDSAYPAVRALADVARAGRFAANAVAEAAARAKASGGSYPAWGDLLAGFPLLAAHLAGDAPAEHEAAGPPGP
jgi:hypothetical protein